MRKAAVLPVPVWAWPATSRPASVERERPRLDRRREDEARLAEAPADLVGQVEVGEAECR